MHAFSRSLFKMKIKKETRHVTIKIFSILLNCNSFDTAIKLFKTITMIYGDPNAVHSQDCIEPFMQVIDVLPFDIDKCLNDDVILNDNDKIELDTVDELLHSSDSIIHQSPFNIEMRKQVPMMNDILDKRKKFENISNPN
ncbi:unnamed protein product [Didymodactylos carnosus]|uniref:Uncharacterized protein n=1 Tax=Didymodactylos carnosus TaxID=1234261 RepID=A0A8S2ZPN5_9BILA|nr:unnamed protein product [Didymodactylos carnosus]